MKIILNEKDIQSVRQNKQLIVIWSLAACRDSKINSRMTEKSAKRKYSSDFKITKT